MSERQPIPKETVHEIKLYERSLIDWHKWLLLADDDTTCEDAATPGSRYGRTAYECAWYAVTGAFAYAAAGGVVEVGEDKHEAEILLEDMMSLAVNDSPSVGELISQTWHDIPSALIERLINVEEVFGERQE